MQPEDIFAPPAGIPAATETFVVFACASLLCIASVLVQRSCCARYRAYRDQPLLPIVAPVLALAPQQQQQTLANLKHRVIT